MGNFTKKQSVLARYSSAILAAALVFSGHIAQAGQGEPDSNADMAYGATAQINQFDALRGYYQQLDIPLPTAGAPVSLPEDTVLTRIIFGSCNTENGNQSYWDVMRGLKPQLFLMIGDNVYGDTASTWAADLPSVRASYTKQASHPEFQRFRSEVPMLASWDDHDYGANDAGGSFAFKEYAEMIFENFWQVDDAVRARPGIYNSKIYGVDGKKVQIILLDTRYFRSDLARYEWSQERRPLGIYAQNTDEKTTILGAQQWQWLEKELEKPADLRLIFSSIQMITEAHDFESWENFPHERARFFNMLGEKNIDNAILLSGDRHSGGFYQYQAEGMKNPVWELTASSFNLSFRTGDHGHVEPNSLRKGGLWGDPNFGQIDIDWKKKNVSLMLKHTDGHIIQQQDSDALKK